MFYRVVAWEMMIRGEWCVGDGVVDEESKASPTGTDDMPPILPDEGVGGERAGVG